MKAVKVSAENYPKMIPGQHHVHQYGSGRFCGIGCNKAGEIIKTESTYKTSGSAKRAIKTIIAWYSGNLAQGGQKMKRKMEKQIKNWGLIRRFEQDEIRLHIRNGMTTVDAMKQVAADWRKAEEDQTQSISQELITYEAIVADNLPDE
jgi:hypothetical protein